MAADKIMWIGIERIEKVFPVPCEPNVVLDDPIVRVTGKLPVKLKKGKMIAARDDVHNNGNIIQGKQGLISEQVRGIGLQMVWWHRLFLMEQETAMVG